MRRIWDFVIDVADGVLGAILYSREGGAPYTLPDLENLNESKLRKWSAGSTPLRNEASVNVTDDLQGRIRTFRTRTKNVPRK